MSHSQFHSTNLFILRHAWLNLWDKHMTTGRINQVTTFRSAFAAIDYSRATTHSLSWWGVRHSLSHIKDPPQLKGCFPLRWEYKPSLNPQNGITSFPILTCLGWDPLVPWMEQRSPTFNGDYQQPMMPKRPTQMRRIPEWLSCIRFDHRQAIHHPSTLLKHIIQRQLETFKGKGRQQGPHNHQGQSPFESGFPHNGTH